MKHLWRVLLLAAAIAGLSSGIAFAQANSADGQSTFSPPTGRRPVPGFVPLGLSPSNVAGGPALGNAGYPPGATPIGQSTTATTGGISNLGLGSAANQYSYLCGFSVSPGSATTAIVLTITLSNATGIGAASWTVGAPATGAGVTGTPLTVTFSPCLRSNAVNQNPTISVTALGAGGAGQTASIWGYTQ